MNKLDNEVINITKSFLTPSEDFDFKINNTLKTMYRRNTKAKSEFIKIYEKILKFFITLVSLLSVTSLAGYAGYKIYDKFNQKQGILYETQEGVFQNKRMEYFTKGYIDKEWFEYKIVNNYNEYSKYKDIISNIILMDEIDFKDNVLLIMSWSEFYPKDGLKIENVEATENKTIVTLSDRDMTGDRVSTDSVIMTVIPKELIKEELNFNIIPGTEQITKYGFTEMKDITTEYVYGKGVEEGVIISEFATETLYNKESLETFLDKVEKGEECAIRNIRVFQEEYQEGINIGLPGDYYEFAVIDTVYENGKFYQYGAVYSKTSNKFKYSSFKKDGVKIRKEDKNPEKDAWYFIDYPDGTGWHMVHFWK